MSSCQLRLTVSVLSMLGLVVGARGAAPPAPVPAKPWTGTIQAHEVAINYLALTPDGSRLLTVGEEKLALWSLATGKLLGENSRKDAFTIRHPTFVNDGREIVCRVGGIVHLLDARSLETKRQFEKAGTWGVEELAVSPDGSRAVGARTMSLAAWDVAKGKILW